VMDALALLASDTRVKGLILRAELDSSAATAYTLWNSNQISTTLANDTASAVRNMIMNALTTNPAVEYVVLVGNDRVVPFRRTPDRTKHPESMYQIYVSGVGSSTIWAACHDKMSLTDDYYVDREPYIVSGQEVYIPDFAIGRLPEGADEIVAFIDNYLSLGTINLERVLVTGADFVVDTGQVVSSTIASDLGPSGVIDGSLVGNYWSAGALNTLQLNTSPAFNVQFINGHASHHLQYAALGGSGVDDQAIYASTANDLRRALVVTLGCHSGLNDVGGWPAGIDLAQAFFKRGANYVANTGYGWGLRQGLGWSERLVQNYVQALTQGASATIGKAVMAAKQRYWSESPTIDAYDEKVLMESTLYGLPHFELLSGGLLGPEDPFPSVVITPSLPLAGEGVRIGGLDFSLEGALGALEATNTMTGTYYSINGNTEVVAGQPMQPGFYSDVTHAPAGQVHGVTMDSAHYEDIASLDPLLAQPSNEWDNDWAEPAITGEGWSPARPLSLQNVSTGRAFTDTVLTQLGQYHGQSGQERLYDGMSLGVYYSASPDWTPPEITYVGERAGPAPGKATIKVGVRDPLSGVLGGQVTYTAGDGQWHSAELAYDDSLDKWTTEIPAALHTLYFVQMVDNGGNVAVADNKGRYYTLPEFDNYLPLTLKLGQ
jgi:Peptidase family C25